MILNTLPTVSTPMVYSTTFITHNTLHPSHKIIHSLVSLPLAVSNNTILILLEYYKLSLI